MYTSTMLLALSTVIVQGMPSADSPTWLNDYQLALKLSKRQMKPVAVVVGKGASGWDGVCAEGQLGTEARQVLTANYVCVYVDKNSGWGQRMASSFHISQGPGLVISDRTGEFQAFHHEGELSGSELEHYLRKYARSDRTVQTTETKLKERTHSYAPAVQNPIWTPPAAVQNC